jgi:hypothetical protein
MNLSHLQLLTGTIEEVTGMLNGAETWGNRRTFKYRAEENVWRKDKWQREERDLFTKLSVNLELDPRKKYRVWLEGYDNTSNEEAKPVDIVRPVRDLRNRFVHTVVEL